MKQGVKAALPVFALGLVLGIWNTDTPFYTPLGYLGIAVTALIAILMLCGCRHSAAMADRSASMVGCLQGLLMGVGLAAGISKLLTRRRMHPYDEVAYGMLCVLSLLLVMLVFWVDIRRNKEKLSFGRFTLQGAIALIIAPMTVFPACQIMRVFEFILGIYVE